MTLREPRGGERRRAAHGQSGLRADAVRAARAQFGAAFAFRAAADSRRYDFAAFARTLQRSEFALCPRGYGPTSYRLSVRLRAAVRCLPTRQTTAARCRYRNR
jgi:hypothetical protein